MCVCVCVCVGVCVCVCVYLYTVLAFSAEFIKFVSRNMVSQTGACTQVKWTRAACSVSAVFSEKASTDFCTGYSFK